MKTSNDLSSAAQPKTATQGILVVGASNAWPVYKSCSAYVCQPNRTFRPLSHIAFYCDGVIETLVPRITGTVESVLLSRESIAEDASLSPTYKTKLLELVRSLELLKHRGHLGKEQKVMFLSDGASPETIRLPHRIRNDKKDKNGNTAAFTMSHRYVATVELMKFPIKTSALE